MDTLQAIKKRRSIRKFLDKSLDFDDVASILESVIYSPSSGDLKNFKIILVTNKHTIKQLAENSSEQYWIATAPAVIAVCSNPQKTKEYYGVRGEDLYSIQNSAAAVQTMLIRASSLGIGSCWVGSFDDEQIKVLLELPDHIKPQAIIPIGYADEEVEDKNLEDLDSLVFFNKYGNKLKNRNLTLREYSKEIEDVKEKLEPKATSLIEKIKSKFNELQNKFNKR